MGHKSDAEAMSELTSLMWSRYLKEQVRGELNHEMNAYKAEVVTNHGDGTLTVQRPFETVQLRLKAAPSLAYARAGDMVLVVGIGDKSKALSNAFILCRADLSDDTQVPVYGLGHNLLDNPYFVGGGSQLGGSTLPINSRGLTSYSGSAGVTIDRWMMRNTGNTGNPALTIMSDGIRFVASGTSAQGFHQCVNGMSNLAGKTVTLSALITENTTTYCVFGLWNSTSAYTNNTTVSYIDIAGQGTGLFSLTMQTPATWTNSYLNAGFYFSTDTGTIKISAIKLEIGERSTLAHREGSTWVLNEVPDYESELVKCITSNAYTDDSYANHTLATGEMLGPVELGITASRPYSVGSYFVWHGNFYRVTSAISSGTSFSPGTGANDNCVQTTVADELLALQ